MGEETSRVVGSIKLSNERSILLYELTNEDGTVDFYLFDSDNTMRKLDDEERGATVGMTPDEFFISYCQEIINQIKEGAKNE